MLRDGGERLRATKEDFQRHFAAPRAIVAQEQRQRGAQVGARERERSAVQLVGTGLGPHDREQAGALVVRAGEQWPRIESMQPILDIALRPARPGPAAGAVQLVDAHETADCSRRIGVRQKPLERPAAFELDVHARLRNSPVRGSEQQRPGQRLGQRGGAAGSESVPARGFGRKTARDANGKTRICVFRDEDEQPVGHAASITTAARDVPENRSGDDG